MGYRVIIEKYESDDSDDTGRCRVEFEDSDHAIDRERLGQLIGYAVKAVGNHIIPSGKLWDGIEEILN